MIVIILLDQNTEHSTCLPRDVCAQKNRSFGLPQPFPNTAILNCSVNKSIFCSIHIQVSDNIGHDVLRFLSTSIMNPSINSNVVSKISSSIIMLLPKHKNLPVK